MSTDIYELIDQAKAEQLKNPPTDADLREHAISFAFGNANIHNPSITRQMVETAYDARELLNA